MADLVALIPAAGTGARMQLDIPKQYLHLAGHSVLWHTVQVFLAHAAISRVHVVLGPDDRWLDIADWPVPVGRLCFTRSGGASRAETVRNGLRGLSGVLAPDDWVLVHDAARPCLDRATLRRLIDRLQDDPVGGILALPVADTLKRETDSGRIAETIPREKIWLAQTPQMFRYGLLSAALEQHSGDDITDEASAIEAAGYSPRLVRGSSQNIKITYPSDLAFAEWVLGRKEST